MAKHEYPWLQVKRATKYEKIKMNQMAIDETAMSKELFHPVFVNDCPLEFKLERHQGYQLQAYRTDNGEMADTSFSLLVVRCGNCQELMTVSGADFEYCPECETFYEDEI